MLDVKTTDEGAGDKVENVDDITTKYVGADARVLAGTYCDDGELVNTYGTAMITSENRVGLKIDGVRRDSTRFGPYCGRAVVSLAICTDRPLKILKHKKELYLQMEKMKIH